MLQARQHATRFFGSFLPLRAHGTTKSTDMARALSKLAMPSRPQYWQRYWSRSRMRTPSSIVTGWDTNDRVMRSNGTEHLHIGRSHGGRGLPKVTCFRADDTAAKRWCQAPEMYGTRNVGAGPQSGVSCSQLSPTSLYV